MTLRRVVGGGSGCKGVGAQSLRYQVEVAMWCSGIYAWYIVYWAMCMYLLFSLTRNASAGPDAVVLHHLD